MTPTPVQPGDVPFEDFIPYVLPHLEGVPEELAAHYIRLASIDMAQNALAIERTCFMDAQEGVDYYFVEPPTGYNVFRIKSVCCQDRWLRHHDGPDHCMAPCSWLYEKPDHIRLGSAPGADVFGGIEVRLYVAPTQDSCGVDRCIYENYAEAIANGALAKMFLLPDVDDLQRAEYHRRLYTQAESRAKLCRVKGHTTAPQTMRGARLI